MTLLIVALAIAGFLVGAVLRHLQGGLDATVGIPRGVVVAGYAILCAPAFAVYGGSAWFGVPWLGIAKAILLAGVIILDMVMAQDFSKPWKVAWRFGAAPVILAALTGFWWAIAAGPVLGAGTALLRNRKVPLAAPWIDGWEAWWEIMIGGVTGALWCVAPVLGAHPLI